MMSQKSSKNNVNFNDFKISLKAPLIYPLIALAVLLFTETFPVIKYIFSKEFITGDRKITHQIFLSPDSIFAYSVDYLFVGMFFCGLLIAFELFRFLISKKQVNVYLSVGLTRARMYFNRISAGIILLFVSSVLPIFITYLVNISQFGVTAYMTKTFLYFAFSLFISGLAGFSIATIAITVSGSVVDFGLVVVAISSIPSLILQVLNVIINQGLIGARDFYINSDIRSAFIPLSFVSPLDGNVVQTSPGCYESIVLEDIFGLITDSHFTKGKINEGYLIDKYYIIPIVGWLIASALLLTLAVFLFKARKAENANSFGRFSIARGLVSAAVFLVCVDLVMEISMSSKLIPLFLIIAVVSAVAYFIVNIIMARKLKTVLKSMILYCCYLTALGALFVVIGTGVFGTYNKTPVKEELKGVAISVNYSIFYSSPNLSSEYISSSNPKDIDLILNLFEESKDEKPGNPFSLKDEDYISYIDFAFECKDGSTKYRSFKIYDEDLYTEYMKSVTESDYFDAMLENKLLGFSDKNVSKDGQYVLTNINGQYNSMVYYDSAFPNYMDEIDNEIICRWHYFDNKSLVQLVDGDWDKSENGENVNELIKGDELAVALYNDLSKMTFEKLYKNPSVPLGSMGTSIEPAFDANLIIKPTDDEYSVYYVSEEETKGVDVFVTDTYFYIYPEMKETIACLENMGCEFENVFNGKVTEILYTDAPVSAPEVYVGIYGGWSYKAPTFENFLRYRYYSEYALQISEPMKCIDILKKSYNDTGYQLHSASSDKFEKIINSAVPYYFVYGDNGRYVYVVYDDGTVVAKYLPETSLAVLK